MKKKKTRLRWIAWTLLLILCMNSVGETVLASDLSIAETETVKEVSSEEETISQEATPLTEENLTEEESFSGEEAVSQEEIPPMEESPSQEEVLPEKEPASLEETPVTEETVPDEETPSEEETPELRNVPEMTQGFDIDFYVIIEGEKVKLQHNEISGIATWEDGRKTYHGVSLEDLISVYQEFGFTTGSDGQKPNANEKFVSAYRGRRGIKYGTVYTDTDSQKTYVSYNDGEGEQGEAVDVYYLPNGKDGYLTLETLLKKKNSFYPVEVKGEGQSKIYYGLTGNTVEVTVSDFNPALLEKTDKIEWTCFGADDAVVDGTAEAEDQTKFKIENIGQSYVIQRADQTELDIQFYVYVDNEIRKLPSDSLKKVYKWNNHGRCYLSVSDLAEIYKEYGLKETETQYGKYFPSTIRGEKILAHAAMQTYKGKQYVSYTQEGQNTSVPTDVYYMPKGAEKSEEVPQDVVDGSGNVTSSVADQLKQNKHSFYSVTVLQTDGSRSVTYHKKDDEVTISVNHGNTSKDDWLCMSADEEKTIQPVQSGENLNFTIQKIEQPYTIAYDKFEAKKISLNYICLFDYLFISSQMSAKPYFIGSTGILLLW